MQDVVNELQKNGVTVYVTKLNIGDFTWVCKEKPKQTTNTNRLTMESQPELVLPYVIERKRKDDLAHSIRDGRYHEQKYRLARTGLNTIYLVEAYGQGNWGLRDGAIEQALANTQIKAGFRVVETNSLKHTCAYITLQTRLLKQRYEVRDWFILIYPIMQQ